MGVFFWASPPKSFTHPPTRICFCPCALGGCCYRPGPGSKGQTAEFKEHLQAQVEKQTKDQPVEAGAPVPTGDFLDSMLSNSSTTFEIVPVVYPQAINSYIGTSLYIDQVSPASVVGGGGGV